MAVLGPVFFACHVWLLFPTIKGNKGYQSELNDTQYEHLNKTIFLCKYGYPVAALDHPFRFTSDTVILNFTTILFGTPLVSGNKSTSACSLCMEVKKYQMGKRFQRSQLE